MSPSIWQILIIAVIVLILFGGKGKISAIMGDLGKGIKSFKKGLEDKDSSPAELENKSSKAEEKDS